MTQAKKMKLIIRSGQIRHDNERESVLKRYVQTKNEVQNEVQSEMSLKYPASPFR